MIDDEVSTLLQLKKSFKSLTNIDWKPDITVEQFCGNSSVTDKTKPSTNSSDADESVLQEAARLLDSIKVQGDKIRQLKSEKREKVCTFYMYALDVSIENQYLL